MDPPEHTNSKPAIFRFYFLGPLQLEQEGQPISSLRSRKALGLIAYLALLEKAQSRSFLVELFWPDHSERRGRANLSWVLNHINSAIPNALAADRHALWFNFANPNLWLDTTAFFTALEEGTAESLVKAADLVRGDLLEGFWLQENVDFDIWLYAEQEKWRQRTAELFSRLSDHFEGIQELAQAIGYTERILQLTPWRESAHRKLIGLLAQNGQRSAALAQYESCRRILREELNVQPGEATEALAAAIRNGSYPLTAPAKSRAVQETPAIDHLPRQMTAFFGRQEEMARIARYLADPQTGLITIAGPGGVGKTRLAIACARTAKQRFAHGAHYVPLAELHRGEELFSAVAEVIGFPISDQPDRPAPRDQVLGYLAQREMLLILDNAEQLDNLAEELLAILNQAPGIKLLVTSRHEVGMQAAILITLHGLPYPEREAENPLNYPAVQLLRDRVQRREESFTQDEWHPALAEIARLVQGYPLALEIAAGLVPMETPDKIARLIGERLDVLRVNYHDFPTRHLSLRALFDHSWRLLSEQEKQILPQLTLFHGGFSAEAVAQVCGASPTLLRGLVEKSLLQRGADGRYSLHNVPRYFLMEKRPSGSKAESNHAAYFLSLFQTAGDALRGDRQLDMRQRLALEESNLNQAWRFVCQTGEQATIAASLGPLFTYWSRRGYAQVGVDFFMDGAALLEERGLNDIAQVVRLQGWTCYSAEELGTRQELPAIAVDIQLDWFTQRPFALLMAPRLAKLCMALLIFGNEENNEPIENLWQQCLQILAAGGDALANADGDMMRGRLSQYRSNFQEGARLFKQAIAIYRQAKDWVALAGALYQYARLEYQMGNFSMVAEAARECQTLYERLGNRQGLQDSYTLLGFVAFQEGNSVQGQEAFSNSLRLSQELGNRVRTANNLSNLGVMAVEMDDLTAAQSWYDRALSLFSEMNDDTGVAMVLANLGILAEKAGDLDEALNYTLKSLNLRRHTGDYYGLTYARTNLGFIYLGREDYREALSQFRESLEQGVRAGNRNWQADALGGIGIGWAHLGKIEEGLRITGCVLVEEGTSLYVRQKVEAFIASLKGELAIDIIKAGLEDGRTQDFDALIEQTVAALSADAG